MKIKLSDVSRTEQITECNIKQATKIVLSMRDEELAIIARSIPNKGSLLHTGPTQYMIIHGRRPSQPFTSTIPSRVVGSTKLNKETPRPNIIVNKGKK